MGNWFQLTIKTNYQRNEKSRAFSLIKNLLDRAIWQDFFYTQSYEEDKIVIKLRILEVDDAENSEVINNRERLGQYLIELRGSVVEGHVITEYKRNHIMGALIRSSRLAIEMDFLPSHEDAGYLIHCILENLFLNNEEEVLVYQDLIRRVEKKISKQKSPG